MYTTLIFVSFMVRNRNLKCVSVLTKDFKNVEGQKKKTNNILIYKVAE